jgi:hypothetical protein
MTATQLAMAYGWQAGLVAFPIAAFTGATRLSDDAHWFSDTVAGAFLGYLVGRATFYDSGEYAVGVDAASLENVNRKFIQIYPTFQSETLGLVTLVSF